MYALMYIENSIPAVSGICTYAHDSTYQWSYLLSVSPRGCLCIIHTRFISRIFLYASPKALSAITDIMELYVSFARLPFQNERFLFLLRKMILVVYSAIHSFENNRSRDIQKMLALKSTTYKPHLAA